MIDYARVWKQYLTEITRLPKQLYGSIRRSLEYSRFWTQPNGLGDFIYDAGRLSTPASQVIQHELNKLSYNLDLGVFFAVIVDVDWYIDSDNPNEILRGANFVVSKNNPIIQIDFENGNFDGYKRYGFDKNKVIDHMSTVINHELIHFEQFKSQAASKGVKIQVAYDQAINDPKQVVNTADHKHAHEFFPVYLTRHIEEEAHAHQAAEELYKKFGKEGALEIISGKFKMGDHGPLSGYGMHVPPERQRNFRTKVYQFIIDFDERDVFDTKPKEPEPDPSGGMLEID